MCNASTPTIYSSTFMCITEGEKFTTALYKDAICNLLFISLNFTNMAVNIYKWAVIRLIKYAWCSFMSAWTWLLIFFILHLKVIWWVMWVKYHIIYRIRSLFGICVCTNISYFVDWIMWMKRAFYYSKRRLNYLGSSVWLKPFKSIM